MLIGRIVPFKAYKLCTVCCIALSQINSAVFIMQTEGIGSAGDNIAAYRFCISYITFSIMLKDIIYAVSIAFYKQMLIIVIISIIIFMTR